jgi:murein L,D-transpeptidase YcbB/YkuD
MRKSAPVLGVALGLLFFSGVAPAASALADPSAVTNAIHERVELVRTGKPLTIGGDPIVSRLILPRFYEGRGFQAAWGPETLDQLQRAIEEAYAEGLNPDDYHRRALTELTSKLRAGGVDGELVAELDILATDAIIRLAYHLFFGKVDPEALDPDWNAARLIDGRDPVALMETAIAAGEVGSALAALPPQQPVYQHLKASLARYRGIAAEGGWPRVPDGPTLKPGMRDERVTVLRKRLEATGDLGDETGTDPAVFDGAVEAAVRKFQERHNLGRDGAVGKSTLEALQAPAERRVDQIRVNLERARWMLYDLPPSFVLVDIAGFDITVFRDGRPVWQSRVQVGRPYRRTPIFRSAIAYLVLNPTWTVPPVILGNDILPAVRKNPAYLASKDLRVIDYQGREVDPAGIDWNRYTGRSFPYLLRQDASPANSLGQIKFMFPNEHDVFLHDTPSKELFTRDERAFSSGCIRVERPFELAELLLNDPEDWSMAKIRAAVGSGETRTVKLARPVPVLIYYWTVQGMPDGSTQFLRDIYGRDDAVLKALDGEFKFRKKPLTRNLGF